MNAEAKRLAARDRVLMYTRGMDIDPETGIALALESLRRAGKNADPNKVMRELFNLLQEKGQSQFMTGTEGRLLVCAPAMSRRSMIAKDMEQLSLIEAIRSRFLGMIGLRKNKSGSGT